MCIFHFLDCSNHLVPLNAFTEKILGEEDETQHFVIFYLLLLGQDIVPSPPCSRTTATYVPYPFRTLFAVAQCRLRFPRRIPADPLPDAGFVNSFFQLSREKKEKKRKENTEKEVS